MQYGCERIWKMIRNRPNVAVVYSDGMTTAGFTEYSPLRCSPALEVRNMPSTNKRLQNWLRNQLESGVPCGHARHNEANGITEREMSLGGNEGWGGLGAGGRGCGGTSVRQNRKGFKKRWIENREIIAGKPWDGWPGKQEKPSQEDKHVDYEKCPGEEKKKSHIKTGPTSEMPIHLVLLSAPRKKILGAMTYKVTFSKKRQDPIKGNYVLQTLLLYTVFQAMPYTTAFCFTNLITVDEFSVSRSGW